MMDTSTILSVQSGRAYKASITLNKNTTSSARIEVIDSDGNILGAKDISEGSTGDFVFYGDQNKSVRSNLISNQSMISIKEFNIRDIGLALQKEKLCTNEGVYIALASIPCREESLKLTIDSLKGQASKIFVYLNGYEKPPEFLLPLTLTGEVEYILDNSGRIAAAAKFYWLNLVSGYYFTCDDDIIYPENYVEKTISSIDKYNKKYVVSYHGKNYRLMSTDMKSDRKKLYKFSDEQVDDKFIDVVGTGVTAFHTSIARGYAVFASCLRSPRSVDIAFSEHLKWKSIRRVCLSREESWIKANELVEHGLNEQKQIHKNIRNDANKILTVGNPWTDKRSVLFIYNTGGIFSKVIFEKMFSNKKIKKFIKSPKLFLKDSKYSSLNLISKII